MLSLEDEYYTFFTDQVHTVFFLFKKNNKNLQAKWFWSMTICKKELYAKYAFFVEVEV